MTRPLLERLREPIEIRLPQTTELVDNGTVDQIRRLMIERAEAADQIERDAEHYTAAMGMSEKHRRLWVEAEQKLKGQAAELERIRKFVDEIAGHVVAFLEVASDLTTASDPVLSESDEEEAR